MNYIHDHLMQTCNRAGKYYQQDITYHTHFNEQKYKIVLSGSRTVAKFLDYGSPT